MKRNTKPQVFCRLLFYKEPSVKDDMYIKVILRTTFSADHFFSKRHEDVWGLYFIMVDKGYPKLSTIE